MTFLREDRSCTDLPRLAREFEEQLRLSRASELARDGRLLEAESLLCPGGKLPASAVEFDLLARIHVRQGRYEDAKRRWRDASKMDRGSLHGDCISVLEHWLAYRRQMIVWRIKFGCSLVLTIVAIVLAMTCISKP